jgi:hypothetical protein
MSSDSIVHNLKGLVILTYNTGEVKVQQLKRQQQDP